MWNNYLKIAFRNSIRNKSFSLINIIGLTIGLVSFLGISMYVLDEYSYDKFHENGDRIYRAIIRADFDGQVSVWGQVPNKLGPVAGSEIPEIEKTTRIFHHNFGDIGFISTETEKFKETKLFFADQEILDVFTIPLLKGIKEGVLNKPGTVILSETTANRYFGDADPVGKSIVVDNKINLEVTGVYKDFPGNSFLQCQLIASLSSIHFGKESAQNWGNASFATYFLLNQEAGAEMVNKKIGEMLEREIPEDYRWFTIALQPLFDIRLHSGHLTASIDRNEYGNLSQVKIMVALAGIILLIAAVNYMNLSTAQSQNRNKEVGIAKTLGATFTELNIRFYLETSLFVLASLFFSVLIFIAGIPFFNSISGKEITWEFILEAWFWVSFVGLWFLLTLLSGFYPSFYLSSFSPKSVLLKASNSGGQATVRKGLVIFQFSISVILIICSLMFVKQMNFIRDKKLGYKPEQVIALMVSAAENDQQVQSLKAELESIADIEYVARSQAYPGIGTSGYTVTRSGMSDEGTFIMASRSSHEILDVLGIKLLAGKSLPENNNSTDTITRVVVNKATTDYLHLTPEDAIGSLVTIFNGQPSEIVGVTEDFHFASMHQKIGPYCFNNNKDNWYTYLLVKVKAQNLTATMNNIEKVFTKFIPAAFDFTFLDQQMQQLYASDKRLSNSILLFAGLAIFIACMGLYALTTYTAEQRTREIGIRKVLGASVTQLAVMLSRDFIKLVIIAFFIGIPIGYYLIDYWLATFAYKASIDLYVFIVAGFVAMIIAWITVSFESFKTARRNPVESLKSE